MLSTFPEASQRLSILVLGESGAGKSMLIKQFMTKYKEASPTHKNMVAPSTTRKSISYNPTIVDAITARLPGLDTFTILDVGGQDGKDDVVAQHERKLGIEDSQAFIVVYSVTSRTSLDTAKLYLDAILEARGTETPVFLVGTRADPTLCSEREVLFQEGADVANEKSCDFFSESTIERDNGTFDITMLKFLSDVVPPLINDGQRMEYYQNDSFGYFCSSRTCLIM